MRYDQRISFIKRGKDTYNPETGDYEKGEPDVTVVPASVMDTRTETMNLVYGQIRQGSLTIQIQQHYLDPFDLIRIGSKDYRVDYRRKLRSKETFIVSEVQ